MIDVALLFAMLLGRPVGLVSTVYDVAGIDGVAVVEYESQFNEKALRYERDLWGNIIGTSYGLFQLFSQYHPQHRDDLLLHIVVGASFWQECVEKAACYGALVRHSWDHGGNRKHAFSIAVAYSIYNSGSPTRSLSRGREVERLRDRLAWMVAISEGVGE